MCECVSHRAVWPGGPKAVKTKMWVLWSNPPFGGGAGGGHFARRRSDNPVAEIFLCVCVHVHGCVCVRQTGFSHAKGQDKDTKNRDNSKWQSGGRAKFEGLVIIKWRNATHTYTEQSFIISPKVARAANIHSLFLSICCSWKIYDYLCVCVCVCIAYRADIFVLNSMLLSPAHELWKCLEVTKHGLQPGDNWIVGCDGYVCVRALHIPTLAPCLCWANTAIKTFSEHTAVPEQNKLWFEWRVLTDSERQAVILGPGSKRLLRKVGIKA